MAVIAACHRDPLKGYDEPKNISYAIHSIPPVFADKERGNVLMHARMADEMQGC